MITGMFKRIGMLAAALMLGTAVSSANATTELQIDVNSITATASSAFSTTFTGTVTLTDDVNSSIAGVLINGTNQTIVGTLLDFSGSITLVGGVVTGGSITIEDSANTVYTASIVAGSGTVQGSGSPAVGAPFKIDGLTFNGTFNASTFMGVDVSLWTAVQPLGGSFLEFKFSPDAVTYTDSDTDIDVFVTVPLPMGAWIGGAAAFGLIGFRRRNLVA